jgi:hypothetical protein
MIFLTIVILVLFIFASPFVVYFFSVLQMTAWIDTVFKHRKTNKSQKDGTKE